MHEPRAEDFGLDHGDLERTPPPWVDGHRGTLVAGLVGGAVATVFCVVWTASGSLPAASFFAVVAVAASLVLLLPAAVLLVCALGCAEDRIRARRNPLWRACCAYRKALAASRPGSAGGSDTGTGGRSVAAWRRLDRRRLVAAVRDRFLAAGWEVSEACEPEREGVDLMLRRRDGRTAAVRCDPGPVPASLARVRELAAVRSDLGVDELILACPGGIDAEARRYAGAHGLELLDGRVLAA